MMTRRGFLGRLAMGLVGACALAKIPPSWIPEPIRRYAPGTIGGIERSTYPFWRNQTTLGASRPLDEQMFRDVWDMCKIRGPADDGKIDLSYLTKGDTHRRVET